MRFDTPIEVTEDSGSTAEEAKRCGSKLAKTGSTLAKTLSTTETIDVVDLLQEAQDIRRKRDGEAPDNVVSGAFNLIIVETDFPRFSIVFSLHRIYLHF